MATQNNLCATRGNWYVLGWAESEERHKTGRCRESAGAFPDVETSRAAVPSQPKAAGAKPKGASSTGPAPVPSCTGRSPVSTPDSPAQTSRRRSDDEDQVGAQLDQLLERAVRRGPRQPPVSLSDAEVRERLDVALQRSHESGCPHWKKGTRKGRRR